MIIIILVLLLFFFFFFFFLLLSFFFFFFFFFLLLSLLLFFCVLFLLFVFVVFIFVFVLLFFVFFLLVANDGERLQLLLVMPRLAYQGSLDMPARKSTGYSSFKTCICREVPNGGPRPQPSFGATSRPLNRGT